MRSPLAVLAAVLIAGCTSQRTFVLPAPPHHTTASEVLAANPLAPDQNVRLVEIARGAASSLALVQIRDRESPHLHTRYDLTVMVLEGHGVLWLDNVPQPMRAGDVSFIPKGTPHFFINEGDAPAVTLVSFAPPFSGPDQQPVSSP